MKNVLSRKITNTCLCRRSFGYRSTGTERPINALIGITLQGQPQGCYVTNLVVAWQTDVIWDRQA